MNKKIISYLESNHRKLLESYQERNAEFLINNQLDTFSDFFYFMKNFGGDVDGKYGYMIDVVEDLIDIDNGITYYMQINESMPKEYIRLQNLEYEHYLLYNKMNNHVVYIEDANIKKTINNMFNKEWNSFDEFLIDFFEIPPLS